jgi:hypothetical protein
MRCRAISATAALAQAARGADLSAVEACTFDRLIGYHLACQVFARHLGEIGAQPIMLARCPLPSASVGAGREPAMVRRASSAVTRCGPGCYAQWRRPGTTVVGTVSEGGSQVCPGKDSQARDDGERIIAVVRIG